MLTSDRWKTKFRGHLTRYGLHRCLRPRQRQNRDRNSRKKWRAPRQGSPSAPSRGETGPQVRTAGRTLCSVNEVGASVSILRLSRASRQGGRRRAFWHILAARGATAAVELCMRAAAWAGALFRSVAMAQIPRGKRLPRFGMMDSRSSRLKVRDGRTGCGQLPSPRQTMSRAIASALWSLPNCIGGGQ